MADSGGRRGSMRDVLEKADLEARAGSVPLPQPVREIQAVAAPAANGARRDAPAAVEPEQPPAAGELVGWYLYGFCSYFVTSVLLPVLFPVLVAQVAPAPSASEIAAAAAGEKCSGKETLMYERLARHGIVIAGSQLSPLSWTAVSWVIGIVVVSPLLTQAAHHLDRGQHQALILIAATSFGSFFCLLTGFFKTAWLFPFYILFIAAAVIVAEAMHTRNLGLMIRGVTANSSGKSLVLQRRAAASELSLNITAIGGIGAALIAAFTYHMLRREDQFTGLWVVSIFSGLIWFVGVTYGCFASRFGGAAEPPFESTFFSKLSYSFTILSYPQGIGSLVPVFLSSFASMCIFTSASLYVIAPASCIKPVLLLGLWILYFMFPVIALPMLHPVQLFIRADAVRMQLLGFFITVFISGAGFYFKSHRWSAANVIVVGMIQSLATGTLHAFGRVLLLDSAPPGKEGAFACWYAFIRSFGCCVGFAVGSTSLGHVGGPFGITFLASFLGIIVLIFGNVSNVGALVSAGHVRAPEEEKRLGINGVDKAGDSIGRV